MASKIVMEFTTATGNKKWSFANADPEATAVQVKTAMQTMITNNAMFNPAPLAIVGAKIVTTTEDDYELPA